MYLPGESINIFSSSGGLVSLYYSFDSACPSATGRCLQLQRMSFLPKDHRSSGVSVHNDTCLQHLRVHKADRLSHTTTRPSSCCSSDEATHFSQRRVGRRSGHRFTAHEARSERHSSSLRAMTRGRLDESRTGSPESH